MKLLMGVSYHFNCNKVAEEPCKKVMYAYALSPYASRYHGYHHHVDTNAMINSCYVFPSPNRASMLPSHALVVLCHSSHFVEKHSVAK